ncbi:MAG: site-2 protease family protein [Candidatus Odinarchaeota archaeon]
MCGMLVDEELKNIDERVRSLFKVEVAFKESSFKPPSYIIRVESGLKQSFKEFCEFLKYYGLMPKLFSGEADSLQSGRVSLKLLPLNQMKIHRVSINIILLLVTLITIASTGVYLSISGPFLEVYPESSVPLVSFGFTLSLMGIVGLHELGHMVSLKNARSETSLPYFIPGIPIIGLPTFGAIILQRTPPVNRDTLFDMGISGPLMSFTVSLIVIIIGSLMSKIISPSYAAYLLEKYPGLSPLPVPLIFIIVQGVLFSSPEGVVFMHPIAYAGWLGLIITALNLFPIGQLDGGHSARAVLGEKWSKYASYAMIIVLIVLGYWLMALLVFLIGGLKNQGPLDDVTPLTRGRKILWGVSMLLLVLSITPLLVF